MRDRLVTVFVALVTVAVVVVIVWLLFFRPPRTVVHERSRTTTAPLIVEVPPVTPLRDSGPKNNVRAQARRVGTTGGQGNVRRPTLAKPQNRPLRPHKRKPPKTPRGRRPKPQRPVYTPPAGGPAPTPLKQCPPVTVTAPLPVTVTTPLVGVNC